MIVINNMDVIYYLLMIIIMINSN